MSDVGGVRPTPPSPRFEPTRPKEQSQVPQELSTLFERMREAYKSGDLEKIQQTSTHLTNYLQRSGVRENLHIVFSGDPEALDASIDQLFQADLRIQSQKNPPTGFPLDSNPSDPTFGPLVLAVKENMYAQVGHRDSLMAVMHLLDPAHYPAPPVWRRGG